MSAIDKNMTFGELLQKYPAAGPILASYGLHCIGCHIGVMETIEQGSMAHGLDAKTIEKMVTEINTKVAK